MNKEELIGKLQMVYVGDTNALNELIGYYDGLKQEIRRLQEENKQLKEQLQQKEDIINKAKEYIKSNPNVFYDEYLIDVETLLKNECYDDYVGEINFISKLLEILNNKGE